MRATRSVAVVAVLAMVGAIVFADAPKTAPSTSPSVPTHVVTKGRLALKIEATGTFLPSAPVEIRIRPDAYKGDLTIVSAASNGGSVKRGDTILQIDPTDLARDLDAARNDAAAAKANHDKANADVTLGEKADAIALKMSEHAAKKGETDLKWWDDLTGPQMVLHAEYSVRQAAASVEDQTDELDQLKKMYKTEDLTNATADIVLKRAVRSLDLSKTMLKMQQDTAKKVKEYDQPQGRKPLEFAVENAKQSLETLKVTQTHAKITRGTALKSAQLALAAAEKKVAELEKDLALFTFKAPADGLIVYGQMTEGGVQPVDSKLLRASEKLAPGSTVMVLFTPGSVRVSFDLPEAKVSWIKPGTKAKVMPVAWPELSYEGTCEALPPLGKTSGAEQTFTQSIDLNNVDARILPGMKAAVKIDAGLGEELPLVPVAAVSGNKVKVKDKDGKEVEREVVTGRSDGKSVEIREGLKEGEEIITGAKP